ncbi:xanthine dehydrogenase family protein subunit M [Paracoccus sp. R12_1]|uniref:FAD binding domain-containing protein n=1 Tax=unclassified Paracoccus (in: a-proteobacteria) TaxID=2688777 RepID=UPI001ADB63C0|nr:MULTISPECIES: xanthine dehydrogenase family protein subunit M [unclassified Paracoccus (in: a-proteobacteria)]MBO9456257.1 xanthine dehydrogenase family protein subunit M [Paracoccus sp. R12_2]MBO9487451.1 xanthine dehydrogenase family protein subunit M [Paracoccus sp. R12_1]
MRPFDYRRVADLQPVDQPGDRLIAGGTNLLDLMKLEVEAPRRLLDISRAGHDRITAHEGGLRIGALVTNADCAADPRIRADYPLLAKAILAGASPQLRNKATTGGNLCQRTRCQYFMATDTRCNKRQPGSGCDALQGVNRNHAILGTSETCIATYPGDMAVALTALDATVEVLGQDGTRLIPVAEFHRLPGDDPARDNVLRDDEVITAVTLPEPAAGRQSYRKIRDRSSYAFALVSVAAVIELREGRIARVALAFGGLAHKPWRDPQTEAILTGRPPSPALFDQAADALLAKAKGRGGNDFKIALARRALAAVLTEATEE